MIKLEGCCSSVTGCFDVKELYKLWEKSSKVMWEVSRYTAVDLIKLPFQCFFD